MGAEKSRSSIEVDARNLKNMLESFRLAPQIVKEILARHGLGTVDREGQFVAPASGWCPLDGWLAAYEEINKRVGASKMFDAGRLVPKFAALPPTLHDVPSALGGLDVAYHLNHRKDGQLMFDPASGSMLEGIGHYEYRPSANQHAATVVCSGPYNCDFDRGIITGFAARFEPRAMVSHVEPGPCRKRGEKACHYQVSW